MRKYKSFTQLFYWKVMLIRIVVNAVALIVTAAIIPDIYFIDRSFWSIIILAIGLGILNAIVKPIFLLLTGQLIFVTFGLLVILVNTLVLYFLERIFPNSIAVDNIWWALAGGLVLGLTSNSLENLLGLTPPIVPEERLDLRKQIEARQTRPLIPLAPKPQASVQQHVDTQSISELKAAALVASAGTETTSEGDGELLEVDDADDPHERGAQ